MCQLVGALAKALASLAVKPPFGLASQLLIWPVVALRHRMSSRLSPLKSPTPTMLQLKGALAKALASLGVKPPLALARQLLSWRVGVLRHKMSSLPSPLKSPVPAMVQLKGALAKALASLGVKPPLP